MLLLWICYKFANYLLRQVNQENIHFLIFKYRFILVWQILDKETNIHIENVTLLIK